MSNIVRAVFGGSKTTRTRRLWKIDKGILLQFVDLNLPTAYQVHFANSPSSGLAKVVTATSDTVEIPYEYLQTGADVYAWVYLTPESGVGYTEYMVTIPVYARPDTTDEEPTPAQQSALDTAISALNSGVESVQAAVAGVQDSIDTALQEAKDSGEFDGADGYTPVKGVDYFDGEKGDTGATGETGNGIASAVLNADYTLRLTYTDGTTWTSGSIRGERGDKGDTGADGYSPAATVTQTETGATISITDAEGTTTANIRNGQDGATFTPAVSAEGVISWTNDGGKTNPQPVSIKGPQGDDYILTVTDKEEIAQQAAVSLAPALDEKAPVIYCEASGAIASFTDGADDLPVQDLVVQIEPVQAGSGDPSPDNVRPITGWTGANVQRTGKNLMPMPYDINKPAAYKSGWYGTTLDGDWVVQTGAPIGRGGFGGVCVHNLKSGTYTFSFDADLSEAVNNKMAVSIWQMTAKGDISGRSLGYAIALTHYSASITFDDDIETFAIRVTSSGNSNTAVVRCKNIQLELGSTATDYEPYQSETYDIEFPTEAGTVYGGSLDVTTGVLTVDRAQIASYAGETLPSTWISDRDVYSAGATPTTGAQVVYELATPQTYQLTPTEIRTLLGQNNIWADTGDTAVTYRADTKLFVEQNAPESPVQDVQVAGVSVLSDGVANVPIASESVSGVIKSNTNYGTWVQNGTLRLVFANAGHVKQGEYQYLPIAPYRQHESTFYGLAKAAGDTTQSASSNEVGQYTDEAKLAIRSMLGAASEPAVAAKYTKPSTGIPASDLASAVQTSLGKADTALQSAPVTSVNGSTGAVVLSIPSTAADVGAIAAPASPATGAFLVWSGNAWTAQTLATWEGGSF